MARTAAPSFWSRACESAESALRRLLPLAVAAILTGLALAVPGRAADPVSGEAMFSNSGGYARLLLKFTEDVASEVTTAGSIIVIRFERPVNVSVERLPEGAPDYVSSVRRDPDGMAIRLSLARRVTLNTMSAGERTFIDFLPDGWSGPPPGLPLDVVRELADRARAAERALRQQRAEAQAKRRPPIRVRALVQPTFVRFVFEMPDGTGASSMLNDQKLTISFSGLLTFDLADAKIAAPPNVAAINQKVEGDTTLVEISMIGDVDVHAFREERNYNIDVAFQQPDKPKVAAGTAAAIPAEAARPAAEKPQPQTAEKAKPPAPPAADALHVTVPAAPMSVMPS